MTPSEVPERIFNPRPVDDSGPPRHYLLAESATMSRNVFPAVSAKEFQRPETPIQDEAIWQTLIQHTAVSAPPKCIK